MLVDEIPSLDLFRRTGGGKEVVRGRISPVATELVGSRVSLPRCDGAQYVRDGQIRRAIFQMEPPTEAEIETAQESDLREGQAGTGLEGIPFEK